MASLRSFDDIKVKVVSKTLGVIFRSEAKSIRFSSDIGQMEILPGHIPVLSNIADGSVVDIQFTAGKISVKSYSAGFVILNEDECIITLSKHEVLEGKEFLISMSKAL
jgi:F0F1-type ATP synthase epsilon subunit